MVIDFLCLISRFERSYATPLLYQNTCNRNDVFEADKENCFLQTFIMIKTF